MKIPKHKCTPYCDPEERIHCVPNAWTRGKSIEDWQQALEDMEVIDAREDSDVTSQTIDRYLSFDGSGGKRKNDPRNNVGYLLWVREK